jgi:hypothetical protein
LYKNEEEASINIMSPQEPPLSKKGCVVSFFIFFGMPLREQGVPISSGAKTKQGEFFVGGNLLIAY